MLNAYVTSRRGFRMRARGAKGRDGDPEPPRSATPQVVNQQAFANNHGIPLAAVIDFVPPASLQLAQVSRPPLRCKACSAYLNAYCQVWARMHGMQGTYGACMHPIA
eukprot:357022-Chlamydomonas_euryale.AAC.3